jgi:outer membrane protein OmpA-like peptidoglycan-associated protein
MYMQKSQQQFRSKSHSLLLSLFCLVVVMDVGRASAQTNTVAPPTTAEENCVYSSSQMKLVKDPFMRTQQPLDSVMIMRSVRMNKGVLDSVGMVTVYFRMNSTTVDRSYKNNAQALDALGRTFQNKELLSTFDYMIIEAGTSPDGSEAVNEELASKRALALKSYIMWQYPYTDRSMIYTFSAGEDWAGLRRGIENDPRVPSRSEVLSLLDSPQNNNVKRSLLRRMAGGSVWDYISQHILPSLRVSSIALYTKVEPQAEQESAVEPLSEIVAEEDSTDIEKAEADTVHVDCVVEPQPIEIVEIIELVERVKKPLFAIKTNLLFDLATVINVEAEVPIGRRWSVAGEWIFPWWLWESDQIAVQAEVASLEVRYWLGKYVTKQPLTGWFVGAHGGWGHYDFEWKDKGYQGELWYAGLSGGYAHTINRSGTLRMEYSLGVGYMNSDYTRYIPQKDSNGDWHLMRRKEAKRDYLGPTRAKVSLVWMLNRSSKKKGGVQ